MRFLDFWRWSLLVMSVSLLWSCESILGDLDKDDVDDEEEEEIVEWGTALLEVSPYNVVFDGESTEQEMHITANYHYTELGIENVRDMEWKIECREMSLQDLPFSFSAASGVGDADVVVTHTSGEPFKEVEVYVVAEGAEFRLMVSFSDNSNRVYIADDNLREYILGEYDLNNDGELTVKEAERIEYISISSDDVSSLEGVEAMVNLKTLEVYSYDRGKLSQVDLSNNKVLESVWLSGNVLTVLNVKGCEKLKVLNCSDNKLENLDVTGCVSLTELNCSENNLKDIEGLGTCAVLEYLDCSKNRLTRLDMGGVATISSLVCTDNESLYELENLVPAKLQKLHITRTRINNLDLSGAALLDDIELHDCNMTTLNLSGCVALKELKYNVSNAKIQSLILDGCSSLETCDLSYIGASCLWTLTLDGCSSLKVLYVDYQHLEAVDLSDCVALEDINFESYVTGYPQNEAYHMLNALDVSKCEKLRRIDVGGCIKLQALDVTHNPLLEELIIRGTGITSIDLRHNPLLRVVDAESTSLKYIYLLPEQQIEDFKYDASKVTIYREEIGA